MNRKKRRPGLLAALLAGAGMALGAGPVQADSSVSGKSAAYASDSSVAFATTPATLLQVSLPKGKKKHVLDVHATLMETAGSSATSLRVSASVNGVQMEPLAAAQAREGCGTSIINCTSEGHWWLDLDQAELANPGLMIGQPLVVTLQGNATGGASNGTASLRVRLVKP